MAAAAMLELLCYEIITGLDENCSGSSTLGPGGTGPPKCWPDPPKYLGN
jgi:hypothetical protein